MTTEEKAKAYDEAFKKAENYHSPETECNIRIAMENLFPELAENEDEKIRKELIEYFRWNVKQILNDFSNKECIAWLEKQGKQKPAIINIDSMVYKYANTRESDMGKPINCMIRAYRQGLNDAISKVVIGKPTDKVEHRFNVGDWVMLDRPVLITKVEDMPYNTHQYWTSDGIWFGDATKAKLWTIQDAKDGNVLVASDGSIFIFASVVDCACKHYVALTTDGVIKFNEGLEHYWEISSAVHPATKEQRDALMKKMTDAGYTFDFEKKELKKIEQRIDDNIPQDFQKYVEHLLSLSDGEGHGSPAKVKEVSAELFKLAKLEQKPAWSEEDENMLTDTDYLLRVVKMENRSDNEYQRVENCINWLKSLENRVINS